MNAARKTLQLAQLGVRRLGTSPAAHIERKNVPAGYAKLKQKMEKFQIEDGVPVFLKGGVFDKILYQFTVLLCLTGLGMTGHLIYELSFPKKN